MRNGFIICAAMLAAVPATAAEDEQACEMCIDNFSMQRADQPLRIEIESGLSFNRMALLGREDGGAALDPFTGESLVDDNVVNLGGISFQGRAKIFGAPLRMVRIELPPKVQLRSPQGAEAVLSDFVTDLPPVVMLDENGMLEFNFGARVTSQRAQGGNFRGKIRIRVDYI